MTMSTSPALPFAPFRVKPEPEIRRLAFWFFLAGFLPLLLMILLSCLSINPFSANLQLMPMMMGFWGLALFYATFHQRVDEEGIWDRALFYRRGWPWSRFAAEHVYRSGDDFYDAKAKWWQLDHCQLHQFTEQQRTQVLEHLQQWWQPPTLAEELQLTTLWRWHRSLETTKMFKCDNQWLKVTFSAKGIVLDGSTTRSIVELLPWQEVRAIDVIRHHSGRSAPNKITVRFRNGRESLPCYLHLQQSDKRTLCQLEPCLIQWSVGGTVSQLSCQGPMKCVREALFRKLHHCWKARELRKMLTFQTACILVCGLIAILGEEFNLIQRSVFIVMTCIYIPVLVYAYIQHRWLRCYLQEVNAFLRQSATVKA
jgi:hypothetical protein